MYSTPSHATTIFRRRPRCYSCRSFGSNAFNIMATLGCTPAHQYLGPHILHRKSTWCSGRCHHPPRWATLGSLFAVNPSRALSSPSAYSSHGYGHGHPATIPTSVVTVGFQASFLFHCALAVDPVSLLLHFQFLSFSGLLILECPPNYFVFTYNFAWANFFIPFLPFEKAAYGLMS